MALIHDILNKWFKAEDTAHATGDYGMMALGVRQNTAAALAGSDGDYQPFITDGSGRLWVAGTFYQTTQAVADTWRSALQVEESGTDSDKTLTVPASTEWQPETIWVEYTSTATAGARQLEICFMDGSGDVIGAIHATTTQAASLTYNYFFGLGLPDGVKDGTYFTQPLPAMILPATFQVRIYDNNAVAATADTMNVQMLVNARAV